MQVRKATPADQVGIESLMEHAWLESTHYERMFHRDTAKQSLKRLIAGPKSAVFVLMDGKKVVGAFAGTLMPAWWFMGDIAMQVFWYVLPNHRGRGIALLRAFERWAQQWNSVKQIMCGNSFSDSERPNEIFERHGYVRQGCNFVKEN